MFVISFRSTLQLLCKFLKLFNLLKFFHYMSGMKNS